MNKVFFVAAALLVAGPALAQSYTPEIGSGNIAPPQALPGRVFQGAAGAFARVPETTGRRAGNRVYQAPHAVHDEYGRVIGADPDPNVRLQLRRDADSIEW